MHDARTELGNHRRSHVVKTPLPAGQDSRRSLSTRHIAWRLLPEDLQRVSDEAPTVLRDNEFLRASVDGQVALLDERTPETSGQK
ncbi:hypothetical protein GOL89_27210 [Sinorhizobium medicae]|nr:hypothetical protein [Sinorhizobium medicae]